MSINTINIIRIAVYIISSVVVLSSFISAIVKLCNSKKILSEIILVAVFLSTGLLTAFTPAFDAYRFKVDENTEQIIKSISAENINPDMFEPCDDMTDKKSKMAANDDIVLYFTLQPVNSDIDTDEEYGFLNGIQEKIYTKKIAGDFGDIIVSPVYYERKYDYFVEGIKGNIVIPVDDKTELFIEYEGGSEIKDCRDYMCKAIEDILNK